MVIKVQRWGRGHGLRLTQKLLAEAQICVGDPVRVTVCLGRIIIEPLRNVRRHYKLKDLVRKIPQNKGYEPADWGPAVGKESW
jgi:antitoxin component of MazEF toxin-antitoxin module